MRPRRARDLLKRGLPFVLAAVGLGAIVGLVAEAGVGAVLGALCPAWPWMGALFALECLAAGADTAAVIALSGERGREVSARAWIRGGALAVACAQLLPGGRLVGEVLRASSLRRWIEPVEGAALVLRAHGTYLVTISLTSFACYGVVVGGGGPRIALLEGLLLWSGGMNAALAALFLLGPRWSGVGRWLGRRVGLLAGVGPRFDAAARRGCALEWRAAALYLVSRTLHALASAVALWALVGAAFGVVDVFASEAIQLVAANTGDAVPGQAGVLEGAYRAFGDVLELPGTAALTVAIALLFRATRLSVALVAALLLATLRDGVRRRVTPAVAALCLVVTSASGTAHAQTPTDEPARTKLVLHQRAVAVLNPAGAEHMIGIGMRTSLSPDASNPLLAGTHLEIGASNYTSPVYSMTGGYVQLSPLAFLVLRAEALGLTLWSLDMDGAGYFPVTGYDADVRSENLPAGTGSIASGYDVQLSTTLQGAVQLGPLRPILWSQLTFEHERLGEEEFHYSPKYDLVLARSDWMVAWTSMLLVEVQLGENVTARLGAYDDLRRVIASTETSHQIGGTAMVSLTGAGCVRELLLFGRLGAFVESERHRGEATGLVGVIARYDLADL